jgi:hypothetical protein
MDYRDFMTFPLEAKELALEILASGDQEKVMMTCFLVLQRAQRAANDVNTTKDVYACQIILGDKTLSMLKCWQDCHRDDVLARLTWSEGYG